MRVSKRVLFFSLAVVAFFSALPGCSTPGRPNTTEALDGQTALPPLEIYRRLAEQYETNQQLPRALLMWRVIAAIDSADNVAKQRIVKLRQTMQAAGSLHFAKGKDYLDRRLFQAARQEFALALTYNPYGEEAADYVRKLSVGDEFVEYTVRTGDTQERIAQTVYRDRSRQFIIAYFSDTGNGKDLKPGRILRLPAPEQETKPRVVHLSKPYAANRETPKIYNTAGAEASYRKGVAYYLAEQFQEAVWEWEETLRLDPDHPNAKRDIQRARAMLRKTRLK
jgi:tetratricopeptide (TPR) repeat protein